MRLLSAFLALVVGAVIYLAWRSGLEIHRLDIGWLRAFGNAHPAPAWISGSLPDGLWQFAFTLVVAEIWRSQPWDARKLVFVGVPALAGVGIELLQRVHVFAGTFDWTDVALSLAGSAVALVLQARAFSSQTRAAPDAAMPATSPMARPMASHAKSPEHRIAAIDSAPPATPAPASR
jgi:hypothetical protein